MELTWSLPVSIDVESLAFSLARDLDYDTLINFIKHLDLAVADWDFSRELIKFANAVAEDLKAEEEADGVKL